MGVLHTLHRRSCPLIAAYMPEIVKISVKIAELCQIKCIHFLKHGVKQSCQVNASNSILESMVLLVSFILMESNPCKH